MTAGQLERIHENLQRLRLFTCGERLEALLQEASKHEASYADFLDTVLREEVQAKTTKNITMRTNLARFPFIKSLEALVPAISPRSTRSSSRTWPRAASSRAEKT